MIVSVVRAAWLFESTWICPYQKKNFFFKFNSYCFHIKMRSSKLYTITFKIYLFCFHWKKLHWKFNELLWCIQDLNFFLHFPFFPNAKSCQMRIRTCKNRTLNYTPQICHDKHQQYVKEHHNTMQWDIWTHLNLTFPVYVYSLFFVLFVCIFIRNSVLEKSFHIHDNNARCKIYMKN